jgi:hypothetical protein
VFKVPAMKFILILLTLVLMNVAAYSQKITFAGKNVPLEVIFSTIQKQTGYGFFYDQNLLKGAKPVTINVKSATVSEVLTYVFKNQALEYSIQDKTILVSKKAIVNNTVKVLPAASGKEIISINGSEKDERHDSNNYVDRESLIEYPIKTGILETKISDGIINPGSNDIGINITSDYQLKRQSLAAVSYPGKYSQNQLGENASSTFSAKYRKSFFVEFAGNGLGLSANIDRRLKPERSNGLGFRAGIGSDLQDYFTFPMGINYITGKKRSSFETGIGITPMLGLLTRENKASFLEAAVLFSAGYRFQPVKKGPLFRFNWTPGLYTKKYPNGNINDPFGFSVGYSFYNFFRSPEKKVGKKKELSLAVLNSKYRKSVFVEMGGNGIGISANLDMRFKPGRKDGMGFRAGAGVVPYAGRSFLTLPLAINYIAGKKKSAFESGIGITALYSLTYNGNYFYDPGQGDPNGMLMAAGILSIGYRYQANNGFTLRAYYTAIYSGLIYNGLFYKNGRTDLVLPGLSIGYRLK